MRLPRFLFLTALITMFSLLFVWQQTEIFRLAYVGQKTESNFKNMLDKNSILRYNLKTKTSLTRICGKISDSGEFRQPDAYMLVKLRSPRPSWLLALAQTAKEEGLMSRLFGLNKTAEAKTVSPRLNSMKIISIANSP